MERPTDDEPSSTMELVESIWDVIGRIADELRGRIGSAGAHSAEIEAFLREQGGRTSVPPCGSATVTDRDADAMLEAAMVSLDLHETMLEKTRRMSDR